MYYYLIIIIIWNIPILVNKILYIRFNIELITHCNTIINRINVGRRGARHHLMCVLIPVLIAHIVIHTHYEHRAEHRVGHRSVHR